MCTFQNKGRGVHCIMAELEEEEHLSEEKTHSSASEEEEKVEVSATKKTEELSPYEIPLPPQKIKVLSEDEIGGRDLLIVGDVHGCFDELKDLLDTNLINSENTCVLFVGDLTNKGPKSAEVVEFVKKNGWYSVRGNHDEISMKEKIGLKEGIEPPPKFKWVVNLPEESLEWLLNLPYAIHVPSRLIVVVHAGLLPDLPLKDQTPDVFLHIRCVKQDEPEEWTWTRKYLEEDGYNLWGAKWAGPEHVYFGHDARRLYQEHKYATGLDTACVYGLDLTAIYPLTRRRLQCKAHKNHTLNDKFAPVSSSDD